MGRHLPSRINTSAPSCQIFLAGFYSHQPQQLKKPLVYFDARNAVIETSHLTFCLTCTF